MPTLDRPGRFKAMPTDWRIKLVNDRPMFEVDYFITHHFENSDWEDWQQYDFRFQAAYWLFKTDGSVNKFAHENLKECFGWSGQSLSELQENNWQSVVVQLVVDYDVWKNQERLAVKFTNPGDSVPNTAVAPDKLRQMDAVWGARLRASAGPQRPPAKPAVKPPANNPEPLRGPASPKTWTPPPEPKPNGECTVDQAWDAFCKEYAELFPDGSDEHRNKKWHECLRKVISGKEPEAFTGSDWAIVREKAPKHILPF